MFLRISFPYFLSLINPILRAVLVTSIQTTFIEKTLKLLLKPIESMMII